MNAPEFNNKINISLVALAMLVTAAFSIGVFSVGILGLNGKIVDEVGGLRSDWERENKTINEKIEGLNKRIDRKIDNHEAVYHK